MVVDESMAGPKQESIWRSGVKSIFGRDDVANRFPDRQGSIVELAGEGLILAGNNKDGTIRMTEGRSR